MKMNSQEIFCQIALSFVPQIGPITARNLIAHLGSAEEIFRATPTALAKVPGIGPMVINELKDSSIALKLAEEEINWALDHQVEVISFLDERYPDRLRENADAPIVLYFKGNSFDTLRQMRIVSIVGTRIPSDYGRLLCEEITQGLKEYGVVVVSGLAFGVDQTAHKTAVQHQMTNFGILGHGLSRVYPEEHVALSEKMILNGGLITEFPHLTGPNRENFPMRNRIIAGLCQALVVIETAEQGGSMITANLAMGYHRDLFAVPGRSKDAKSRGCNKLIKDNKATLIESAADIANAMGWKKGKKVVQKSLFASMSPEYQKLLDIIRLSPEISIDDLSFKSGIKGGLLASYILDLEFQGVMRTLPGKRYILVEK
jgi:DNA processing protein